MKKIRCAIYTRKSAEEGLEQEFNSLDAQREACAAYVASQKAEGWVLLPTVYEDAGISGGTLERTGLQRLLADIRRRSRRPDRGLQGRPADPFPLRLCKGNYIPECQPWLTTLREASGLLLLLLGLSRSRGTALQHGAQDSIRASRSQRLKVLPCTA